MARSRVHNFHVPLDETLYAQLRHQAELQKLPATTLVREAIALWLKQQAKLERCQQLADYAAQVAGTSEDLEPELEEASAAFLLSE